MPEVVLRTAEPGDFPRLSGWIAEICETPQHHCVHSWSGQSAEALCEYLLSCARASEFLCVIATRAEDSELVGAAGSEYDEELGRSWLYGPHSTAVDWQAGASSLLSRLLAELPLSIKQWDAYLNVANARGRDFYVQQGFAEGEVSHEYQLAADAEPVVSDVELCGPLEKQHESSLLKLYDELFPGAYYNGERILKMNGDTHRVFSAVDGGELVGFTIASVDGSLSTGGVEFVGVREECRGRGYGRRLLMTAADWLRGQSSEMPICLNVRDSLANARGLYESAGFELRFTGVGLRRGHAQPR